MKKQTLIVRLFSSYILLAVIAIGLTLIFASRSMGEFYLEQSINNLEARATLVGEIISREPDRSVGHLDSLCNLLGAEIQTRITLIDAQGRVLADSDEDPKKMDLHNDRPEFIAAFEKGSGVSRRSSYTLEEEHLYFARLLNLDMHPMIVRVSFPTDSLNDTLTQLKRNFVLGGLLVILLIAVLNWVLSQQILRPIKIMEAGAKRFAQGKLKMKVPVPAISELGNLAQSLNQMAEQIYDRIRTVTQQKNEQIAILSSMTEGVIALDPQGTVLSTNKAAEGMFGIKGNQASGRKFFEVIRHAELIDFVNLTLGKKKSQVTQIKVFEPVERVLNVVGSRMPSKKGAIGGAVIVITDLTQIQKLEGVRRDFVANVSHELKTPITSIQGFVETLQDGAIHDAENAEKFLKIIAKHAMRLGQIVDDLLELSRIEEIPEGEVARFPNMNLSEIVKTSAAQYQKAAKARNIAVILDLDDSFKLPLNAKLMAHGLGNLLDNAIKYSDQETQISVTTRQDGDQIILEVKDQGPGIEQEHLERIFERFYRIDKGRSREVGGTGLGLSIVKHIARVHHAQIQVDSTPGAGTTFRLCFPQPNHTND